MLSSFYKRLFKLFLLSLLSACRHIDFALSGISGTSSSIFWISNITGFSLILVLWLSSLTSLLRFKRRKSVQFTVYDAGEDIPKSGNN